MPVLIAFGGVGKMSWVCARAARRGTRISLIDSWAYHCLCSLSREFSYSSCSWNRIGADKKEFITSLQTKEDTQ